MNFNLLSKHRNGLMGIAILGVFTAHFIGWSNAESFLPQYLINILMSFSRLIFTEGFLLLSGLGLYYSFSKNDNLKDFYIKRLKRLIIPFIFISFPFYLFNYFVIENEIPILFLNLSSLYFWFFGNNGMWYISISVALYILFPILYNFIFRSKKHILIRVLILICISMILNIFLEYFYPLYFEKISIGITKIPIFIFGIYMGYCSSKNYTLKPIVYLISVCFFMCMHIIKNDWMIEYYESILRIISIPVLCVILSFIDLKFKSRAIFNFLNWFGRLSLELYIMHMLFHAFLSFFFSSNLT